MFRKALFLLIVLFAPLLRASAINNCIPLGLNDLSTSSVYSVMQDKLGAVWLNTSIGLFRFNGHKLEAVHNSMPWHSLAYDGDEHIYAPTLKSLCRFNVSSSSPEMLSGEELNMEGSVIIAEADSVIVASDNKILSGRSDTLRLLSRLPDEYDISAMIRLPSGELLAGTSRHGLVIIEGSSVREVLPLESKVLALYLDPSLNLWAGLFSGGFIKVSLRDFRVTDRYSSCGASAFKQVRTFASDSRGNLYIGAVNGLFRLTPDGILNEELLGGMAGSPVCGLFVDRDDNLWTGTYYSGVWYANLSSYPFSNITLPDNVNFVRSLAQDKRGDIWMFTDNYGMWKYSSGVWTMKSGSQGIKYQGSFYQKDKDLLWIGDYAAPMLRYNLTNGATGRIPVVAPDAINSRESVVSVIKNGDTMYLGGTHGLYAYNPEKESSVTRALPGLQARIYDMELGRDGTLWIASQGLWRYEEGGEVRQFSAPPASVSSWNANIVSDITIDEKGRIWLALVGGQYGVVCYDGESASFYGTDNCGLADNHTAYVVPLSDSLVLVGTVSGLSILDTQTCSCFNYGHDSGLNFKSARGGAALVLSDGSVLAGGGDGLALLPAGFTPPRPSRTSILLDAVTVNGKRFDEDCHLPFVDEIELGPHQNNFSFDVASFDYTRVSHTSYKYCMEGFDKNWHEFDIDSPVSFMNMKPGRYTFRVRAERSGGETAEDSLVLVLHPAWYETMAFRILLILAVLASVAVVLYSIWTRMMLAERLRRQERENIERVKFFVDISYQLRTPVNLIIGQIERFFKDFGSRTKGVENIEDVYVKAKSMRTLISEFVDKENEELEKSVEPDSQAAMAAKDAKFLNAAIGVVERNLFTRKLDVGLLCSELNVGKTTLTARLKAACGQTPQEFIEDIRLKHAARMLLDGSYRVAEVSDRLGFSSPKYFSTRFKKKFGCVPSDYCRTSREDL